MYVLRDKDGAWHVASDKTGTYVRVGAVEHAVTLPNSVAREFAQAILEAVDA